MGKGALARRAHASGVPMSHFRRATIEGGLFFFTIALANRSSDLLVRHIDRLRRFYVMIQRHHPFETIAICVLPDHLHALWRLPSGDADFPRRWSLIKSGFSRGLPGDEPRSRSKLRQAREGTVATPILGTCDSQQSRSWAATLINSLQSREARAGQACLRLAVQ